MAFECAKRASQGVVAGVVALATVFATLPSRVAAQPTQSGPVIVVPESVPPAPGAPPAYGQPAPGAPPAYGQAAPGGYAYGPQYDPYRRQTLEQRLAYLLAERSQYRIGGPIAMIAVGAGVFVFAGSIAWALWAVDGSDLTGTGTHRAAVTFTAFTVGGGILALVGAIKLGHRNRLRHQFDPEIRQIRQELRSTQPVYGHRPTFDVGLANARLSLRF